MKGKRVIIEHATGGYVVYVYSEPCLLDDRIVCRTLEELLGVVVSVYARPDEHFHIEPIQPARTDSRHAQEG